MSTKRNGRLTGWLGAAAYLSLIGLVCLAYFDTFAALSGGAIV